jgi:hypothetical protein
MSGERNIGNPVPPATIVPTTEHRAFFTSSRPLSEVIDDPSVEWVQTTPIEVSRLLPERDGVSPYIERVLFGQDGNFTWAMVVRGPTLEEEHGEIRIGERLLVTRLPPFQVGQTKRRPDDDENPGRARRIALIRAVRNVRRQGWRS